MIVPRYITVIARWARLRSGLNTRTPRGDLVLGAHSAVITTSNVFKGVTLRKVAFRSLPGFSRP